MKTILDIFHGKSLGHTLRVRHSAVDFIFQIAAR